MKRRNPLKAGQKFNLQIVLIILKIMLCRNPLEAGQKFNEIAEEEYTAAGLSQSP